MPGTREAATSGAAEPYFHARVRRRRRAWGLLRRPQAALGFAVLAVVVITALGAPFVAPHDPYIQSLDKRLQPPFWTGGSLTHPLGTDQLGRDILSRLI